MAASQKQIAEELGVSVALVSRVLSGKAKAIGIASGTIDRVTKTARSMGYVPSAAALSLKGKATGTIGVVVYDFKDSFFAAIIEQLQSQAHHQQCSLVLTGFINRTPQEEDLRPLHKHAIDGLVVIGSDMDARWLRDFASLPVVRIGHGGSGERSVRVAVDEEQAGALLVQHLRSRGRQQLVCLGADLALHRLRQDAFQRAAHAGGMDLACVESSERDPFTAGLQLAGRLVDEGTLAKHPGRTALVCTTDQVAMGALHILHRKQVSVPDTVAVTGFDDIVAAGQFIPPLTTVRQPLPAMVQHALAGVTGGSVPSEILVEGDLIVRESA